MIKKIEYYPARAQSARARRACALRALGLLLADGAPTVGWGKTFGRVGRVPLTKTGVTRKRNDQFGRDQCLNGANAQGTNASLTKIGVTYQKTDFRAEIRIFG